MHPYFLAGIAALLVAVLNFFSKSLLEAGLSPFEVCACRESVTAIVFAMILLIVDRNAFRIKLKDLWIFILFAAFNVISNISMFAAQDMVPLEVAAVLEMTSPYFILVFAFFLFGDRITKRKVLASVIMFLGCVLITGLADGEGDIPLLGVAVGLLSGVTLAGFTLGSKYTETRNISENSSMFYFFMISALMVLPFADLGHIADVASYDIKYPFYIVLLGILGTLIPNYIVIYGTRRGDPATIAIIITSSIVASTIIGIVAFGDDFGFRDVIGIILVMLAITLLDPPKSIKERVGDDDPLDEDLL